MPKKSLPPADAGLSNVSAPPAILAQTVPPRSFDPALAKAGKPGLSAKRGFAPNGKTANRLIHAQKARGR
jgi:hypothetical protein